MGAIANLIDEVGNAVVQEEALPMNVSVDMSISYLATAKLNVSKAFSLETMIDDILFFFAIFVS